MRFGNAAIALTFKEKEHKTKIYFMKSVKVFYLEKPQKPFDVTAKLWKLWTEDFRYFLQSSEYRTWIIQNSVLYYVFEDAISVVTYWYVFETEM